MKKSLLILLFALASYWGWGQTPFSATYTFGANGNVQSFTYNGTVYDGITMGNIEKIGVTTSSSSGNFRANNWPLDPNTVGDLDGTVDVNKYIGFTITAGSGYKFTISTITFGIGRSATGTRTSEWRGSADSYGSIINNYTLLNGGLTNTGGVLTNPDANSSWTANELTLGTNYSDITTNAGFRFYMYNAEAIAGTAGLQGAITITGTYTSVAGNNPPVISNISQNPFDVITSSSTVSVSADVTDSDGTVAGVELHWGTSTGVLTNTIAMSNGGSGNTYTTVSNIPVQVNGTTIYYEVYATDDDADFTTSPELSYNVIDPATTTLPYTESFVADLGDCYPYSVSGSTKYWIWNSGSYAYMSGFNSGETEEDWLVLPGINLNNYSNEFMTFETWYQYGSDDANNYLKLYYSTDYLGVGNPTSATWTELPYTQPGASQVWTSSGFVDLTGISGTMVYIAFKYNYEVSKYRNWGLDNISIMEYDLVNWANLQWPGSGNITVGTTFTVYAQCWEPGVTDSPGQGAGITTWIGYSTSNTNPSTWTNWVPAAYLGDVGNNDEYSLNLGPEILSAGTYYYASRFQLGSAPFQYGGFNGGFWNGVNNVSGVLTINPPSIQIDWANLQWPPNGTITLGGDFVAYAQVYEPGVTDLVGQGADITCWIGYNTLNTDPSTWTNWVPATFNVDAGIRDEYMANIGAVISPAGTYYYASRFKFGLADYVYGGFVGGFWDGVNNVSGELTVNLPVIVINEVDSDTPGTDIAEFVEIFDGGTGNTSLNGLVVVFYNGSNDLSYAAYDLDGYSTDANGYFVLGNSAVTNVDYIFTNGSLQNGQDAVALYMGNATSFPTNTPVTTTNLLDALVYDTDDADDPGLLILLNSGEPQINENGKNNGDDHSCQRIPNGSGGQRNTNTYDQTYPTPGAANFIYSANWTGATSSDWSILTNWSNGIIPDAGTNANIPDVVNDPILATTAICKDLSMETLSKLDIAPLGKLTVSGTFTNSGSLIIKSDATGTGSLIENNGVSATVERYLTDDEWHYISAPVDNPTANVFLGIYMMEWDEPTGAWTYITNPSTPLNTDMEGFSVWTYNPATVLFSGNLNTGAKSIDMTNTPGAPIVNDGYNFAGNPYPSSVDWDLEASWTKTNLDNALYIWIQQDINGGNYGSYIGGLSVLGVTNIISPHQGFFVHVSTGQTSGNLGVNNGARIHASQDIWKSIESISDILKLRIEGNNYSDEMILNINPESSIDIDNKDATKFRGSEVAPQLYSLSKDNKELSINSFPVQDDYMVIPVGLEVGNETVYTISVTDFAGFDFSTGLYLEDLKEGTFINLNESSTYSFTASPLDEPMRFLLHLNGELAVPENNSDINGMKVYSFNKDVYVTSKEAINGTAMIYDLLGREIVTKKFNGETMVKINLDNQQGYMIVSIMTDQGLMNQKVYIR